MKSKVLISKRQEVDVYMEKEIIRNVLDIREDRLFDHKAIINVTRASRPHSINIKNVDKVKEMIKEKEKDCIFCDVLNKKNIIPKANKERRYVKGECVLFQNKFPFSKGHLVAVLTKEHFVDFFKEHHFYDAFLCVREYVRENASDSNVYINFNYLPSAGASILHPHIQILVKGEKTRRHRSICRKRDKIKEWLAFHKEKGLIVGETDTFYVVVNYVPLLNKNISIISKKALDFASMKEETLTELSNLVSRTINNYQKEAPLTGVNMATFSDKRHNFILTLGTRAVFSEYYTVDKAFLELLHNEHVISVKPEDYAKELRMLFS